MGRRVLFIRTPELLAQLGVAQQTGRLGQTLLALFRLDLLIIDELGYMPISPEQANLLFQLVSTQGGQFSVPRGVIFGFPFTHDPSVPGLVIDPGLPR